MLSTAPSQDAIATIVSGDDVLLLLNFVVDIIALGLHQDRESLQF